MKKEKMLLFLTLCLCFAAGCGEGTGKEREPDGVPGTQNPDSPGSGSEAGRTESDPAGNGPFGEPVPGQPSGAGSFLPEGSKVTAEPAEPSPAELLKAEYSAYPFGRYIFPEDERQAEQNLNTINLYYLCEMPDGSVYYSDPADGRLYHSSADGRGRTQVSEGPMESLQARGDTLYCRDSESRLLYRYTPADGFEQLFEGAGCYAAAEQGIYYCGFGGVYWYSFESGGSEKLIDTGKYDPIWLTVSGTALVYQLTDPDDLSFLQNGLVFCHTLEDGKTWFLTERVWRAVLQGKTLVFQNYDTGRIALLDMETGERTQTPLNSESARFTGGTLYGLHEGSLYSWNAEEQLEAALWKAEGHPLYCYFTSRYVYLYTADKRILFYDMETGNDGVWKE